MYNKITLSDNIKIMFSFSDTERSPRIVGRMAYVNVSHSRHVGNIKKQACKLKYFVMCVGILKNFAATH